MTKSTTPPYVELHARSAFSFLNGASQPARLAETAAAKDLPAMALCDRNGVYGSARFHKKAQELGIQPIVGCELFMEDESVLPVIVRSRQGYQNLCRLLTNAHLRAEKGQGRIAWKELPPYADGLIALSGDHEGPLHQAWSSPEAAALLPQRLETLLQCFGRQNLYLEIQRHQLRSQSRWEQVLRDMAEQSGLPLLATNSVCYATPLERRIQDVFTCLRHKRKLDTAGQLLAQNSQRFLKSPAEMAHLFRDLLQAIENTARLAERVEFSLQNLGYQFPSFPTPPGHSMESFLRQTVWDGARRHYGSKLSPKVKAQLDRELDLIIRLGFSGYFLVVWDLVNYCRDHHIMIQGRGSAANSAVCFCLDITPVDPVGGRLLFERFLSEGRKSWPDIDLDLPSGDQREQVIQEVYRRYGRHGAAMTANVITYRGRSAIREIGKVLDFPEEHLGRFSSLFGGHSSPLGMPLQEKLAQSGIAKKHPRAAILAELYQSVLGLPRHLGQHSGGMVICQGALDSVVPLEPASMPGRSVVQWDKEDCEDLGIVKVDLLGLGMMAAMQEALGEINRRRPDDPLELATIPKDDSATFEMMQKADTIGVFQIESRAQMATLPRMKPKCFYDVVIEVAIIRPGPIQGKMVNPYLERRAGRQEVTYIDPRLEADLKRTLGVPLFQEQILKMAMIMADFSGGEADELRRAVSFYRKDERVAQVIQKVVNAMRAKGVEEDKIQQVIDAISSFAHYGFPESHAISFGLLAYASTYLKAHYPADFYSALLNNQPMGFYAPATLIQDAKRHGIRVLPVDVTRSRWTCATETIPARDGSLPAEPNAIRLGLCQVKGLGSQRAQEMLQARAAKPFRNLRDFRLRSRFNRDELRALASIGALNVLAGDRRSALWAIEESLDSDSLFTHAAAQQDGPRDPSELSPLQIMDHLECLQADYRGVGYTIGAHPMSRLRDQLPRLWTAQALAHGPHDCPVTTAGQVICRQRPGTAKGFLFISLEDETGIANIVVTPQIFERHRLTITQEPYLLIRGRLQNLQGVTHVKAQTIEPLIARQIPTSPSHDFH